MSPKESSKSGKNSKRQQNSKNSQRNEQTIPLWQHRKKVERKKCGFYRVEIKRKEARIQNAAGESQIRRAFTKICDRHQIGYNFSQSNLMMEFNMFTWHSFDTELYLLCSNPQLHKRKKRQTKSDESYIQPFFSDFFKCLPQAVNVRLRFPLNRLVFSSSSFLFYIQKYKNSFHAFLLFAVR